MLLAEYRSHDGCRYRVWTREDSDYGAFHIVTRSELKGIIAAFKLMGGECRRAQDTFCDEVLADSTESYLVVIENLNSDEEPIVRGPFGVEDAEEMKRDLDAASPKSSTQKVYLVKRV